MSKHVYGSRPKPSPRTCVERGFRSAEHWSDLAQAIVDELEPHLRTRTGQARIHAREAVEQALARSRLIPIGGSVADMHAADTVDAVMAALADSTMLSDRAMQRSMAPGPT